MNSTTDQNKTDTDKNKKSQSVPEKRTDQKGNQPTKQGQTTGRSNQINSNSSPDKTSEEKFNSQDDDEDGISSRSPVMNRNEQMMNNEQPNEMDNL